jgi:hypothetical protein
VNLVRENLLYLFLENTLNENMQQAKSILKKLGVPETDSRFQEIKRMLLDDNRIGYIGKFTKWVFLDRESMSKLIEVYDMVKQHPSPVPPIDTFKKIEDLFDFLQGSGISIKVNQVTGAIPSRARQNVTDKLKKMIELNIKYAPQLRDFYSKKGGKFKTAADLYDSTEALIKNLSGGFNLESMKKKIKETKSNVEIMLDHPDILVIRPMDYEASHALGSQSWCISYSKNYWDSYADVFSNQYFVFDFTKALSDKRSMIGATVNPDSSFKACHYKDDSVCNADYLTKLLSSE